MQKKDLSDVRDYVDNFQSKSDVRKKDKEDAELIYNKDGWKVYRIKTYDAAKYYGKGTKWCISGNYEGEESRGERYFNAYISSRKLDGGYYFYINDDNDKYCLLRRKDGTVDSIWAPNDLRIKGAEIFKHRPDFQSVPGVYEISNFDKLSSEEKDAILMKAIKKCKSDLSEMIDINSDKLSFTKPSIENGVAKFKFSLVFSMSSAKISGEISLTYKSPIAFDFNYAFIDSKKLLNRGKGSSGTIKDVAVFETDTAETDELYEDFYDDLTIADADLDWISNA